MILWLLFIFCHTFTIHSPYIHHIILTISTNNHSSNKKCHVTLRPQCGPSSACRDDGSHGESGGRWHAKANLRPGWAMVMKPPIKNGGWSNDGSWSNEKCGLTKKNIGDSTKMVVLPTKHGGVTNKNSFANENGGWTKQQTHWISGRFTHFHMKPISMAISKSRFGGRWKMRGNRKLWGKHHPKHLANMFLLLKIIYDLREKNLHHWWLFTRGFRMEIPRKFSAGSKCSANHGHPKRSYWSSCFCPFEPGVQRVKFA